MMTHFTTKCVANGEIAKTKRKSMLTSAVILSTALWLSGCNKVKDETMVAPKTITADSFGAEVATKWADLELILLKTTAGFTPPVASRAVGYMGLTMYESVVPGIPGNKSLAGQLNGLNVLPKIESNVDYNWAIAANAGQASITRSLFANATLPYLNKIDSLETALNTELKTSDLSMDIFDRSVKFGKDIAANIFEYSKTDGGHEGYKRNFPADYVVPVGSGLWRPTENGIKTPMQPYWGKNRTFVITNSIMDLPTPIPYSTSITSQYFAQYLEVYTKNINLQPEEKETAVWWADNPGTSFTPPGHSYSIANIAVKTSKVKLDKAAEAFARVGIAVNDAFILCWKCKFLYNNERPYTYVRYAIEPSWKPFWPAPPFPGFSSGHATQSMATAEVLTSVFGNNFSFTDVSHVGRADEVINGEKIVFKQRSFGSFYETAQESAMSRFFGGIHTRQDNDTGLVEGRKIGKNVNALNFKK